MHAWWQGELRKELSQGDVVLGLPFTIVANPPLPLRKETGRKGVTQWLHANSSALPTAGASKADLISQGLAFPGVVVSHSCEIDKPQARYLHLAPVIPIMQVNPEDRVTIEQGKNVSKMYLPASAQVDESYADLRLIVPLPIALIRSRDRVASMTDEATELLQARLVAFFTYRAIPCRG